MWLHTENLEVLVTPVGVSGLIMPAEKETHLTGISGWGLREEASAVAASSDPGGLTLVRVFVCQD